MDRGESGTAGRRRPQVMARSSSYAAASPGGSPCSAHKSPILEVNTPSHPPVSQADHLPVRLRKSCEILVRKPTNCKPDPPPRKYFRGASPPLQGLPKVEHTTDQVRGTGPPSCGKKGSLGHWGVPTWYCRVL